MTIQNKILQVPLFLTIILSVACSDTDFQSYGGRLDNKPQPFSSSNEGEFGGNGSQNGEGFGDGSGIGNDDSTGAGHDGSQDGLNTGTDGQGGGNDSNEINIDDYSELIAGTTVEKVGISFEDGSDNDYNDISVCFNGHFKVQGTKAVMAKPGGEMVRVNIKRLTGATVVKVQVRVIDETSGSVVFDKDYASQLGQMGNEVSEEIHFPFNSRLYARYQWSRGSADTDGTSRVRIEQNVCNNTGG